MTYRFKNDGKEALLSSLLSSSSDLGGDERERLFRNLLRLYVSLYQPGLHGQEVTVPPREGLHWYQGEPRGGLFNLALAAWTPIFYSPQHLDIISHGKEQTALVRRLAAGSGISPVILAAREVEPMLKPFGLRALDITLDGPEELSLRCLIDPAVEFEYEPTHAIGVALMTAVNEAGGVVNGIDFVPDHADASGAHRTSQAQ